MRILVAIAMLLSAAPGKLHAQDLPEYCQENSAYRQKLQSLGPIIGVGASGSSGLLARPFPLLVAGQMCLTRGAGYEARYSIFFFGSKISFVKKINQIQMH